MPAVPTPVELSENILVNRDAVANASTPFSHKHLEVVCAWPVSGQYGPGTRVLCGPQDNPRTKHHVLTLCVGTMPWWQRVFLRAEPNGFVALVWLLRYSFQPSLLSTGSS